MTEESKLQTGCRSNGLKNNIEAKSTDPKTVLQFSVTVADSNCGSDKIPSSISDNISRDSSRGMTEKKNQTDCR